MDGPEIVTIAPGMFVYDANGVRIGTVAYVFRQVFILPDSAGPEMQTRSEDMIEVKTGFLNLGRHLHVPLSAVDVICQGSLFLGRPWQELEQVGSHYHPAGGHPWR
jgi:hypothetical protein